MTDENIGEIKEFICKQFNHAVGYEPNIDKPESFNEKLQWLKLYYRNPLMTVCADKYEVRNYVREKIGEKYLVKLIGVFDNVDDINFDNLPDKFILKVNHGSGQNIICKNKSDLNINEVKDKLSEWMLPKSNHYFYSYEWCYKDIKPKIVCEELIQDSSNDYLDDYKFMCFNGEVKMVFVCSERQTKLKVDFFDLDWNKLPFTRLYDNSQKEIKKPKNFDLMIKLAEKLSKPFPFVRVDFYEVEGRVYFGEMTFYPGNGMESFKPVEWDYNIGKMLNLPK